MYFKNLFFVILFTISPIFCSATIKDCYAKLNDSTLTIGNSQIERNFQWNDGQLITINILNKQNGKSWINQNKTTDFLIPGISGNVENAKWSSSIKQESPISPAHLEVVIDYNIEQLQIKRVFRIYPDCPAIGTDTYLKASSIVNWDTKQNAIIDQLSLSGKHWQVESVEFFDTSDKHNTYVEKTSLLSYNADSRFRGNLLFAHNAEDNNGLFFLKESPCSINQLYYPGYDYVTNYGTIKQVGLGIQPTDLLNNSNEWIKAYSSVLGVYDDSPNGQLIALRSYQKNMRKLVEDRDEMIVMNTWGDRADLKRLTEDFCIAQMKACSELGITHFQIDWGWQEGAKDKDTKSIDNWSPNKELYPNGFKNIIEIGKKLGVELCLYFVPKKANDNAAWEEDADAIINLYKNHGVRIFKLDGQMMANKTAEINTRKMYDKVMMETNYEVLFNLDITNAPRGGYFYLNETGNLFVENRYTKWANYFPYQVLRNLWMLSKYVPTERLQFEFLNKWKNEDSYSKDDPFSPKNYSFDYLFAITMVAQPLAFFDATELPSDALENKNLIKDYRKIQHDLHKGYIFPIGSEPNGRAWTGFQSVKDGEGYFIIFREDNETSVKTIETFLDEGVNVELQTMQGERVVSSQKAGKSGLLTFSLPEKKSFEIYKYFIK